MEHKRGFWIYIFFFILLVTSSSHGAEDQKDLVVYHTNNPPWGSQDRNNGFIFDIVEQAFTRADLPHRSPFLPWKRAQMDVINKGGHFMAPLTRLKQRENNYIWVAPINISKLHLVTNDKTLHQKKWPDLLDIPVVARRGSPAEYKLQALGFKYITTVENETVAARMFTGKHLPLWMQRGLPGSWAYHVIGGDSGSLYTVAEWSTPLQYLATSKKTPPDVVEKLRKVLVQMREEGEMDRIKRAYFPFPLACDLLLGCTEGHPPSFRGPFSIPKDVKTR
ncbi:substrate-binding periplasmic protein [Paremcibacter congregatus]|uniref:substrate-binding periplasmic protein n=1 Tax=Paremcibacter congregatus TaxID=2043170 RepID=UPI003A9298D1